MDKHELIGGAFRALVSGGSSIRLAHWAKSVSGRSLAISLQYVDGMANWSINLVEADGTPKFQGVASTLESVIVQAVAALGKDGFK